MRPVLLAKLAALSSRIESPLFLLLAPVLTVLVCASGAFLFFAIFALVPPAASAADAADFQRPAMYFQQVHPYACFERVGAGSLSLFGCDDDGIATTMPTPQPQYNILTQGRYVCVAQRDQNETAPDVK